MDNQKPVEIGLLKLFPTLVYQIDASELVEPCVKILNDLLKPINKKKWTGKINNATYDKFILKDDEDLRISFQEKVNKCASVLEYKNGFKMTTSWWTRIAPGDAIPNHKHSNCFFSAVFYPYANSSSFVLESFAIPPMIDPGFKSLDPLMIPHGTVEISPPAGSMLVFPSSMYHWTKKNETRKDRFSLAMNFMPDGFVGAENRDSTYNYQ